MTEREIFFEALDITSADARAAYLQVACGRDVALRRQVDALLREHFSEDSLLSGPALEQARPGRTGALAEGGTTQMVGRYKLLEKIGEGGFGEVWMAEQREPVRRRVALKLIKPGMDSKQVVARFEAERQALALMDHLCIAKVFDAGATTTGRPYFVMELVRGVRITDYCDRNHLTTKERLDLFIKVCQAIQHAHQKGIIHRDIKPSNVMVTLHDGVPVPKVIDFGIAKATQQELTDKTVFTQFQQFIGTPAYISPEQAEMSGLDIDTRADIYSLGVLLYELLVGQTPFDAKEMMQAGLDALRRIIREKEPLRPSTRLNTLMGEDRTATGDRRQTEVGKLVHQLQGDLDWIVMKCLEKDRDRRYDTANGLAMDIQRHLADEPVVARPPSAAYRLQKTWMRNRLAFTAAVAVAAALLVGLGVSIWMAVVATRAKTIAIQARTEAESSQRKAESERQRADTEKRKAFANQQFSRRLQYSGDMNLAQHALKLSNFGNARRLLERNRPQPGDEDLRGWEWRYLWQLTRSDALTLTNRPARGFSVSFSPDGTRLAVGWYGGRVDLWDVPGRRWVRSLADQEHIHHKGRVAFSPVRNLLAATFEPGEVVLHDLDSGQVSKLWRVPDQGFWDIRDLSFSQDGSKVVIYAGSTEKFGDAAWVVDASSSRVEGPYPTAWSNSELHGAARLSSDNQRIYLAHSDSRASLHCVQCFDLATHHKLWETKRESDYGLTALALSPDGKRLASGSGFEDPGIRIWDTATGDFIKQLDGHSGWVCKLSFTHDGRRLISSASDQTIRFWDTDSWLPARPPLHGHTDEVYAIATSEAAGIVASTGKDGNLMLWEEEEKSSLSSPRRLAKELRADQVLPMDHLRVLLLPPTGSPEWIDLRSDSPPVSLPELGPSTNVLGVFGADTLCRWDGTNRIFVHGWRGAKFVQQGAISLDPSRRPTAFAYDTRHQLLAWTEGTSSASVYVVSLATPDRRAELRSDAGPLVHFKFSEDGRYLAATAQRDHSLRVWDVGTGKLAASLDERVRAVAFAAGGRVLVAAIEQVNDHEIGFFDLDHPGQAPRRVPGKGYASSLAVSPDGGMVASGTAAGEVWLFDALKGEVIEFVQGHLHGASGVAFSPDGRRLISTSSGVQETVKIWDVATRQELLTLMGSGSLLDAASWTADGDVILTGAPWQVWRAPSWEEIAARETMDKAKGRKP